MPTMPLTTEAVTEQIVRLRKSTALISRTLCIIDTALIIRIKDSTLRSFSSSGSLKYAAIDRAASCRIPKQIRLIKKFVRNVVERSSFTGFSFFRSAAEKPLSMKEMDIAMKMAR